MLSWCKQEQDTNSLRWREGGAILTHFTSLPLLAVSTTTTTRNILQKKVPPVRVCKKKNERHSCLHLALLLSGRICCTIYQIHPHFPQTHYLDPCTSSLCKTTTKLRSFLLHTIFFILDVHIHILPLEMSSRFEIIFHFLALTCSYPGFPWIWTVIWRQSFPFNPFLLTSPFPIPTTPLHPVYFIFHSFPTLNKTH